MSVLDIKRIDMWGAIEARVTDAAVHGAGLFIGDLHAEVDEGIFESPIEAVFAAWWLAVEPFATHGRFRLSKQFKVSLGKESARLDFVVALSGPHPGTYGSDVYTPYPLVAIELDGHEFHERTKEQATRRNRRDRLLQGAGWKVLHVSGSELYRDPEGCVTGVITLVEGCFSGFWSQYRSDVKKKRESMAVSGAV